jgi:hypothetical protein
LLHRDVEAFQSVADGERNRLLQSHNRGA